jgi:single-strand DNA-binding protein
VVALRAVVLDPGRVFRFGKRLLSRAHRAASSTCKNFFLKTPQGPASSAKKVLASQALNPRHPMRREALAAPFHPPPGVCSLRRDKKRRQNMIDTNETRLIGFLGADPELKTTDKGTGYAVLSVATSASWKKADSNEWETRTEWHRVVVWGKQANRLTVSKGDKVLVIGEIRYREYDDEVAKGKTKIEVKMRMAEIHAAGVERLYKAEKADAGE